MTARFHPEFPADVRRFAKDYAGISIGLGERFRGEIDAGIVAIKSSPGWACLEKMDTNLGSFAFV